MDASGNPPPATPSPPSEGEGAGTAPQQQQHQEQQHQEQHVSPASLSSPVSPPYWHTHARSHSTWSNGTADVHRPAIVLEDNELTGSETSKALWARHCAVSDYVVVAGNSAPAALGSYVVWNCKIDTLDGGPIHLRKRYSEFDKLRRDLVRSFPHAAAGGAIPPLPPKSMITKFQPKFLEKRRQGLTYFLNCVLLNPEFSGSPVLKDFLFM